MFENPFSFQGRIRRTEYGLSLIIIAVGNVIFSALLQNAIEETLILVWLYLIPSIWFIWAQSAKRCHDLGNSGWWQIIPFYGLWLLFQDGNYGSNQYGENPKRISNANYQTSQPNSSTSYGSKSTSSGSYQGGYSGGHNNHSSHNTASNHASPNYSSTSKGDDSYKPGDLYK